MIVAALMLDVGRGQVGQVCFEDTAAYTLALLCTDGYNSETIVTDGMGDNKRSSR